ncbi:hypothetical protein AU196_08665 [Mycobacterium sp. IS-1742]|uniref:hypothetical protein n=1 Tax=Mycobacterium sp. IS-1742 TaxID=1772285 RepID=UPI000740171A|nr:hypothetical protein [Mycobacterium sp. IS-1742]KUI31916.1 hypothetical protein AU196_08665 [Mycobacterium sp. IS-1742]
MVVSRDAEKDLGLVLSYLTGRKLTLDEVLAAVGMSRSTYYDRQGKGTLTTTDTLLRAARNLDLNPVDLLIRYGRIAPTDVADYLEGEEDHPFGLTTANSATPANPPEHTRRRRSLNFLTPRGDAPPL